MLLRQITKRVINGVYQGVTTVELDNLAAETAAYMTTRHPVSFSPTLVLDDFTDGRSDIGLRHPRCSYRYLQLAQGDQKDFLSRYRRSLQLQSVSLKLFKRSIADMTDMVLRICSQPQEWSTVINDFKGNLRSRDGQR